MIAYFPKMDFGFSIATNAEGTGQDAPLEMLCIVYNMVEDALTGTVPYRTCSFTTGGYYGGHCECQ